MPKSEVRHPEKAVSTGAYSAGVLVDGWLYIIGQGPLNMTTGEVISSSIEDETRLTLSHIEKILDAAGMSFADVVKCTCHLSDIANFSRFDKVYAEFFPGI